MFVSLSMPCLKIVLCVISLKIAVFFFLVQDDPVFIILKDTKLIFSIKYKSTVQSFVEFLVSSILVEDQRNQVVYFGVEPVR